MAPETSTKARESDFQGSVEKDESSMIIFIFEQPKIACEKDAAF